MPPIIRKTPFFDGWTELTARGQHVRIKPYQIIVWVSISEIGRRELDPNTPRFPAVLDTALVVALVGFCVDNQMLFPARVVLRQTVRVA